MIVESSVSMLLSSSVFAKKKAAVEALAAALLNKTDDTAFLGDRFNKLGCFLGAATSPPKVKHYSWLEKKLREVRSQIDTNPAE